MKAVKARITRGLPVGSYVDVCDNSGAKVVKIFTVKRHKTVKRRRQAAGIGDLVMGSVVKGRPDMRKKVVFAVVVRQKMAYRRLRGERIKFEDNALVVLKDDKGNPKGTLFKGPIAKEAAERWPNIAKLARIVV
jgi:large subunit ribosomal protein L14